MKSQLEFSWLCQLHVVVLDSIMREMSHLCSNVGTMIIVCRDDMAAAQKLLQHISSVFVLQYMYVVFVCSVCSVCGVVSVVDAEPSHIV